MSALTPAERETLVNALHDAETSGGFWGEHPECQEFADVVKPAVERIVADRERALVERVEAVVRIALNLLDRQVVTREQLTHSDGVADGIAAIVDPLVKTLGYANAGVWLRENQIAKRCGDDLHEHTLINGVVVCRECWGFPEQAPVIANPETTSPSADTEVERPAWTAWRDCGVRPCIICDPRRRASAARGDGQ